MKFIKSILFARVLETGKTILSKVTEPAEVNVVDERT